MWRTVLAYGMVVVFILGIVVLILGAFTKPVDLEGPPGPDLKKK